MGLQQYILSYLSAGLLFFALYYMFTIVLIHKKLFDKHFYFFIYCILGSLYLFFHLLLSLAFSNEQYLLFHRLKILSAILVFPVILILLYEYYFIDSKKYLPYIVAIISPFFIVLLPFDIFLSFPINTIIYKTSITSFIYHLAKTNIGYSIWAVITFISALSSMIYFLFSKKSGKRIHFLISTLVLLFSSSNDFLVTHKIIENVMLVEYGFFSLLTFMFVDFLLEDRKTYRSVIDLSKQLSREKNEAIRRLRITEIYTRRSLVESIEKGEDPTKFQPNNVQIATLFTDIRDFTGISEGLKPLEVVELLNSYFNRMNSSIIKHKGEIDKLMGDCIMALFHNPDDSLKAAIEMRKELTEFNIGVNNYSPIQNGIGLNYGEVIIGNIGSESKMDYTVVGDIVNTASRLEALTKYYKVHLIISEEMKKQLEGSYHIRFLDEVLVKGKSNPMKIYEVFDFESPEVIAMKERNVKPLAEAFAYYQQGEFEKAIEIYESVVAIQELPLQDPVLPFFISRCRKLQEQKQAGLLKQWSGVFEFMDK